MHHMSNHVLGFLAIALAACGENRPADQVMSVQAALSDISFSQASLLEQEIELFVRLSNPNPFEIEAQGMRFDMELGGTDFARGMSNQSINLAPLSETIVPVKVRVATADLVDTLLEISSGDPLAYAFDGILFLQDTATQEPDPLPFEGSATVRLPDIERFLERFGAISN